MRRYREDKRKEEEEIASPDKAGPKGYRVVTRSAMEDIRNGCGVTEKTKEKKKK